jgi:hypothetical protein
VVQHPRDLCGRRAAHRGLRAGQAPERGQGRSHYWECAGLFWRGGRHAGGVRGVESEAGGGGAVAAAVVHSREGGGLEKIRAWIGSYGLCRLGCIVLCACIY